MPNIPTCWSTRPHNAAPGSRLPGFSRLFLSNRVRARPVTFSLSLLPGNTSKVAPYIGAAIESLTRRTRSLCAENERESDLEVGSIATFQKFDRIDPAMCGIYSSRRVDAKYTPLLEHPTTLHPSNVTSKVTFSDLSRRTCKEPGARCTTALRTYGFISKVSSEQG
jgi:hypothetical protein